MIAILLKDGFEEIEALSPADILRRAGADVRLCGAPLVTGGHGITVQTDCRMEDIDLDHTELIYLPGGKTGVDNLWADETVRALLQSAADRQLLLAAICAAPSILGRLGLLTGKKAVCYPGFEEFLIGAEVHPEAAVVVDGKRITGKAAGVSNTMGFVLTALLYGQEKADALRAGIYCDHDGRVLRV